MKKTLIALALITLSGASFAQDTCNGTLACSGNPTVGDNRNGQVVGTGQIANGGISRSNSSIAAGAVNNTNNNTNAGGSASSSIAAGAVNNTVQGSTQSQTATGGNATGGSVTGSGNSSSTGGSVSGSGNSTATGGSVGNTSATGGNSSSGGNTLTGGNSTSAGGSVGNTSSNSGGNTLTGGAVSNTNSTGASTSSVSGVAGVNGGINTNINVSDNASTIAAAEAAAKGQVEAARLLADATRDQKIRNTPSISPSALTSSNDTCMGSASGSISAPGIGLALGKTYTDDNCVMLKNSRELWNMGMRGASMALMCTNAANRDALELTGYECPQTSRENGRKLANGQVVQPQYTDPIVRARLGLAPLK